MVQSQAANQYVVAPPRPYLWKTDEFQINDQSAPKTQQYHLQQPSNQNANQAMAQQNSPYYPAHNFRCPRCGTNNLPIVTRQISTAGWITFGVLLVMTLIFFWIGLLMKEDVRVCSVCGLKLG